MPAVVKSPKHEVGPRHPESKFFLVPKILEEMRKGVTRAAACRLCGVSPETMYEWVLKGRRDPEKYPEYAQLAEDLENVKALMQRDMVDVIVSTATSGRNNTWQAAAWYLERTDPENWAKRDKVEVRNEGTPLIQLNQVVLSDENAREASRDLLNRLAAGGAPEPIGLGAGSESAGSRGRGGSEVIDVDSR